MTIKLYEDDSYLKKFKAIVTACEACGANFAVELSETAFFPEGGGQPADVGTLGEANVLDVQEKGGRILHITDAPLEEGTEVEGKIDWDTRFFRMQNHTGEHLLSGVIHWAWGYNNVGFHMGHDSVTLDVDGPLTAADIEFAEEEANRAVYANVAVTARYPERAELETMSYRSKLETLDNIRIVTIEGYDTCACCAPHVAHTAEIGMIKILSFMPNKGGTRIELLCGHDALDDYRAKTRANAEIMKLLSVPADKTVETVDKTLKALAAARAEIKALEGKLALASMEKHEFDGVTAAILKGAGFDEMRTVSNDLIKDASAVCAVLSTADEGCLFTAAGEDKAVGAFVNYLRSALNAKGGGKGGFAQGKIPAGVEEVVKKIEEYGK